MCGNDYASACVCLGVGVCVCVFGFCVVCVYISYEYNACIIKILYFMITLRYFILLIFNLKKKIAWL
ncbi:GM12520 [Drosophila sechellia]|uniref:GM12520 n=1 Tax=Drosophila sechellia TaxID=7238 RepID=B4I067_DROSE|nr:GM12520 [Drosophila sechellia]